MQNKCIDCNKEISRYAKRCRSCSKKGHKQTEEAKEKCRVGNIGKHNHYSGKNNPNYGKHRPCYEATKQKALTPERIQKALKNGFGTNCYYNNEFFPSLQERDCYIKLKELGFRVKHNFEGRFDFLVNDKIVVEFHPFDIKRLTDDLYYMQRRELLDNYGYKNLKLIVIKNLKEIENNLLKEVSNGI